MHIVIYDYYDDCCSTLGIEERYNTHDEALQVARDLGKDPRAENVQLVQVDLDI
jgi:hypothetical protein